jgi:hypothetical protein
MSRKVLITGARSAVAIDMARDFSEQGYEVHLADCSSAYVSRWSRIPERVHRYAPPARDAGRFIADIRRIAGAVEPEIIVPTCEEVFYLPSAFSATALRERVFAPPASDLDILHNKYSFAKLCDGIGLSVPETHRIDRPQDVLKYKDNAEKWVFKPCYSRFGAETLIAPAAVRLDGLSFDKKRAWVAQKLIRGYELSFYAIAKSGRLVALAVYTSSWRLKGGASYVFEPVSDELFTQVKNIAEGIAATLNLTCQFSCDLIEDDAGRAWLIECNPRATSGLHLLRGQLAATIAGAREFPIARQTAIKYMLPMMMTHGFINAVKGNRLRPWFETVNAGRDVIGGRRDRLPVCGAMLDTAIFMLQGMRKGLSLSQATTADIEWNGEFIHD